MRREKAVHTIREVMTMERQKRGFSKVKTFLTQQGFYVVLVLCLLIVGAAVTILALPNNDEQAAAPSSDPNAVAQVAISEDETLQSVLSAPTATPRVLTLATGTPLLTASPTPTPTATPKAASTSSKAAPPLSGEIVWGFATDRLIYSKTLDQWTTHEGVDIASDVGTEVKCVLGGTVQSVREDDVLGFLVTVEHSNDRVTLYANLGADIRVKTGDRVNAGTVLGTVGSSALSECAEAAHLHFAFYISGKAVDPSKYVRLG